ncbi:MAG: PAS domain S-box protein, partial [Actinomycetota bacterium]
GRLLVILDQREKKVLEHQLRFEKLVARISKELTNFTYGNLDNKINNALELIGSFANVDRSYVFLLNSNNKLVSNTHEWCAKEVEAQIENLQNIPAGSIPWWMGKINRLENISTQNVDEMDPEAAAEKKILKEQKIKSVLVVPLVADEKAIGFMGFDSVKKIKDWQREEIRLLEVIAEIIGSAIKRSKLEKDLFKEKKRFKNLVDTLPEIVVETDSNFNIVFVNRVGFNLTGYTKADIKKGLSIFDFLHSDDRIRAKKNIEMLIGGADIGTIEYMIVRKDGKTFPAITNSSCIYKNGKFSGLRILAVDISKQKRVQEKIKESEKKYRELFENSLDGIYRTTLDGRYIDANPALIKMLGYSDRQDLFSINIEKQLYANEKDRPGPGNRNRIFETRLKKKDGTIIWAEISSRVIYEKGIPKYYEGIVRDITYRKKMEKQLRYKSFHDQLTGLYNRVYFEEEARRLDSSRNLPISVIMGDINSLKLINDAFGYKEGDKILCEYAKILEKCCRKSDIVSRYSGDEFSIILPNTKKEVANNIIARIRKELKKSDSKTKKVSISLGCVTKTKKETNILNILKQAENNMYKNKLLERDSISASIIKSLDVTLTEKSLETENHAQRLKEMAKKFAKEVGLSDYKMGELLLLCNLHDIGKIAIPEKILTKKGKLTDSEWKLIKRHPGIGYNIAKSAPQISHIAKALLNHHEWWDGSGYPKGLKGEDIPIVSRILSIIDAYDVMINGRVYKKPMSKAEAIKELKLFSGKQFDPNLVDIFINKVLK